MAPVYAGLSATRRPHVFSSTYKTLQMRSFSVQSGSAGGPAELRPTRKECPNVVQCRRPAKARIQRGRGPDKARVPGKSRIFKLRRRSLVVNAAANLSRHRQYCCALEQELRLRLAKDFKQRRSHAEIPLAVGAAARALSSGVGDQIFQLFTQDIVFIRRLGNSRQIQSSVRNRCCSIQFCMGDHLSHLHLHCV
jgi:hypothetical protein